MKSVALASLGLLTSPNVLSINEQAVKHIEGTVKREVYEEASILYNFP